MRSNSGMSLTSVLIAILVLSIFSLLLAQILGQTQKSAVSGLNRNSYQQNQGNIQLAAQALGSTSSGRNLIYSSVNRLARIIPTQSNSDLLEECFSRNHKQEFCIEFSRRTQPPVLLADPDNPRGSALYPAAWGINGICPDPDSESCVYRTATSYSIDCNANRCFSIQLNLSTEQLNPDTFDEARRAQLGIPNAEQTITIKNVVLHAYQFTQEFNNPNIPDCRIAGLTPGEDGAPCADLLTNVECTTSLVNVASADGCSWTTLTNADRKATGRFTPDSYVVPDNGDLTLSLRLSTEGSIILRTYRDVENPGPDETFSEDVSVHVFDPSANDKLMYKCPPPIFAPGEDWREYTASQLNCVPNANNPQSCSINLSVTIPAANLPSIPQTTYTCVTKIMAQNGSTKGLMGSFDVTLLNPVPPDPEGPIPPGSSTTTTTIAPPTTIVTPAPNPTPSGNL